MGNREIDAGHAGFGLNDPPSRHTTAGAAANPAYTPPPAAPAPAGSPGLQYVYVQGPPPGMFSQAAQIPTRVYVFMTVLLVTSILSLYLAITGRHQSKEAFSKQSDEINLLT